MTAGRPSPPSHPTPTPAQGELILRICEAQTRHYEWLCSEIGTTDADEVMSDAYLVAVERVMSGYVIEKPEAYGRGIVDRLRLQAIKHRRRGRLQLPDDYALQSPSREPSPEDIAARNEARSRLTVVVDRSHRTERELIRRILSGEGKRETCAALGIKPHQYDVRKNRAKARLLERVA